MSLHPSKSKFLCINTQDNQPFALGNVLVSPTSEYVYLGALITNDSTANNVKKHLKSKQGHTLRFVSFLRNNADAPFSVKKLVWNSALLAAIFYGSETWLCNDLKAAEKVYMTTLKQLLGVRMTTCHDLVLLESGMLDTKSFILKKQVAFFKKLMSRPDYVGSYLEY